MRMPAAALAVALPLAAAPAALRADEAAPKPSPAPRPRMEVAFVLDTTGSMGGLIETAKRKIWAIANDLVKAKPSPDLRLGLVAFRDRGDEYVVRVTDLDADLDRVYGALGACQAGGGGDGPESVNEALRAAVTRLSWTSGTSAMKVVFLVGDAPPHMDYGNDVPWTRTCEEAVRAGIVVHTLRCGGDPSTEKVWTEIAKASEGTYASIPQEGSETVATPFDERIAALGARMGEGFLAYGEKKDRDDAARKVKAAEGLAGAVSAPAAPAAVAADRAEVLGARGRLDDADLVALVAAGTLKIEELDEKLLPDALKALAPAERRIRIEAMVKDREVLRKELEDLGAKRAAFLAEALKKGAAAGGKSAFDLEVAKSLRALAAKKGFTFAE